MRTIFLLIDVEIIGEAEVQVRVDIMNRPLNKHIKRLGVVS
jgi:hypothetical protein